MSLRPFHLAIPVTDLQVAHDFYVLNFNCKVGRTSNKWMDFDFFGHQLVAHLVDDKHEVIQANPVDGEEVPSRHFGIVLEMTHWKNLVETLKEKNIDFFICPQVRFKGKPGEQATFFLMDPFGNALEFKAFQNDSQLFEID